MKLVDAYRCDLGLRFSRRCADYITMRSLYKGVLDALQVAAGKEILMQDSGYRLAKQTRNTEVTGPVSSRKAIALYREKDSSALSQ